MTLNKVYVPAVDQISRAVNNLSMSADAEFRRLDERITALENAQSPFFHSHIHSYSATQSFVVSASYTNICSLTIDRVHQIGDHYFVIGLVNLDLAAGSVYAMRLTDGTTTLYEAIDLERAGHGTEVFFGVDKPSAGKTPKYYIDIKRTSGLGNMTYVAHAMFAISGYSEEE